MHESLIKFQQDVVEMAKTFSSDRSFNELLTGLISDLHDLSDTRVTNASEILARMFARINEPRRALGQPDISPRVTSEAYDTMRPTAITAREIGILVEIMRSQVHVMTATGKYLDQLGEDYNFLRFEATQARHRGITEGNNGVPQDFPVGSRLLAPDSGSPAQAFLIESTEGGNVIFVAEQPGAAANRIFGILVGWHINGLAHAEIVDDGGGAYRPGQDRETDESYRRRFLAFLRRTAFGGNVAQYIQFTQAIDGVSDLMVFPCWRGAWHVNVSIVGADVTPVSDEFCEYVNNQIDPLMRSGTGFGTAPVGHRVNVMTPIYQDISMTIPLVPLEGATEGQIYPVVREIIYDYIDEMRQAVLDMWEQTYFHNIGVTNSVVNFEADVTAVTEFIDANRSAFTGDIDANINRMLATLAHFPPELMVQRHTFDILIQPQLIGTRILTQLQGVLISAVDFENIRIDGEPWLRGFPITSTETEQRLPRLPIGNLDIILVV